MPFSHSVRLLRIHADAEKRNAVELPKKKQQTPRTPTDRPIERVVVVVVDGRRGPPNDD
jgi:hypothetical protein